MQQKNLYVAGNNADNVVEFANASGSGAAIQTYRSGIDFPSDVAFDHSQNMWVDLSNSNTLIEYSSPYTGSPIASVNPTQLSGRIAFDNHNNLFVTSGGVGGVHVAEYAPPYTGAPILSFSTIGNISVSLDDSCNLYVGDVNSESVIEYAPPYTGTPLRTIVGAFSGLFGGTASDSHGDLFVADAGNPAGGINPVVREYGKTGTTPIVTIPVAGAVDVALDHSDNLWVLDPNGGIIQEYAFPYTAPPIKTLTSGLFGSGQPSSLRFGP